MLTVCLNQTMHCRAHSFEKFSPYNSRGEENKMRKDQQTKIAMQHTFRQKRTHGLRNKEM